MNTNEIIATAKKIHRSILTLDTHIDIEVSSFTPENPGAVGYEKMASFARMEKGGMDGAFFAAYALQGPLNKKSFRSVLELTVEKINTIHRISEQVIPQKVKIAYTPHDVHRIHKEGKIIAIIGLENGYPIGKDLKNIKKFYDLGVRYITLSHNGHNQICDSNMNPGGPESLHGGVSDFGKKVIAEMNRYGIIVDVSHVSKEAMIDAKKLSRAPIIASHSACRTICNESRNMDDEQLYALKEKNGMINIIAISEYIKKTTPERRYAVSRLREKFNLPEDFWPFLKSFMNEPEEKRNAYLLSLEEIDNRFPPPSVEDYVDHIDHVVKLIGIDHVGIGSDYYSKFLSLENWNDAGEVINITIELVKRGYTKEDIQKIWSGNILRVWNDVEKVAVDMQEPND